MSNVEDVPYKCEHLKASGRRGNSVIGPGGACDTLIAHISFPHFLPALIPKAQLKLIDIVVRGRQKFCIADVQLATRN